jgi:hypothetical protein
MAVLVGHERLKTAYGHRLGILTDHAITLAEPLLRAKPTAGFGKGTRFVEHRPSAERVTVFQLPERARNVVVNRTGFDARRCGALDAAFSLHLRNFEVDGKVDFVPIADANVGGLFGQFLARYLKPRLAVDFELRAFRRQ